jgi:hypothetical protein
VEKVEIILNTVLKSNKNKGFGLLEDVSEKLWKSYFLTAENDIFSYFSTIFLSDINIKKIKIKKMSQTDR